MARYLLGCDVREVHANADFLIDPFFDKIGDWDTAVVTLTFKKRALATLDNSRKAVYGYDQRMEMFGFGGMIAISKL